MSKVTTLIPRDGATVPDGFKDAISGTAIEATLDEQRQVAWEIEAVLRMAAIVLDPDTQKLDDPNCWLVLRRAADRLSDLADNLEAPAVECRAAEIAREREAEAQGGAA